MLTRAATRSPFDGDAAGLAPGEVVLDLAPAVGRRVERGIVCCTLAFTVGIRCGEVDCNIVLCATKRKQMN